MDKFFDFLIETAVLIGCIFMFPFIHVIALFAPGKKRGRVDDFGYEGPGSEGGGQG